MLNASSLNFILLQTAASAPEEQLNAWTLIMEATVVVQAVMVLLVLMSVACWFIMGTKGARIAQASSRSRQFLDAFWDKSEGSHWTTERLEALYARLGSFTGSPLASVFKAGYVELARVMAAQGSSDENQHEGDLENVERALKRTATNELTQLEARLPFLATTGSTGPFVGLFGTVWGIMNAFLKIKNDGSAGIDSVAPGIAEALIATAIGLVAAIPAVMAYNYFIRRIRVMESEVDAFSNDLLNIVRRYFLRS